MKNIEKFDQCSAEILALLYESFPVKVNMTVTDYPEYDNPEDSAAFLATIEFLCDEKLIRFESAIYGGYVGIGLTAKGLMILNSIPLDGLDHQDTLGYQIKYALTEQNQAMIKSLINVLISSSLSSSV